MLIEITKKTVASMQLVAVDFNNKIWTTTVCIDYCVDLESFVIKFYLNYCSELLCTFLNLIL